MRKQSAFRNGVVREFDGAARRRTSRPPEPPPALSTGEEAVAAPPAFLQSFEPIAASEHGCGEARPQQSRRGRYTLRISSRPRTDQRAAALESRAPGTSPWPQEDCANEPTGFFACGEPHALWALGARVAPAVLVLVVSLSAQAVVREGGAIGLTVGDLDREVEFLTKVLPFEKVSEWKSAPGMAIALDLQYGLGDPHDRSPA